MPKPELPSEFSHPLRQTFFRELRERLLRAGVAPRHVRRYLAELADHFTDLRAEEERPGQSGAAAEAAAFSRLGGMDELVRAMTGQRRLQSWSARAPWAALALGPVFALGAAYLAALLILWTGWKMFLPGADTPFGTRVDGFASLYFQVGKALYRYGPILTGWGIVALAARQRLRAAWPTLGLLLVAVIGAGAQVHAGRTEVPHGLGHISMDFSLGASGHELSGGLLRVLLIFSLAALPYLIWRVRQGRERSV